MTFMSLKGWRGSHLVRWGGRGTQQIDSVAGAGSAHFSRRSGHPCVSYCSSRRSVFGEQVFAQRQSSVDEASICSLLIGHVFPQIGMPKDRLQITCNCLDSLSREQRSQIVGQLPSVRCSEITAMCRKLMAWIASICWLLLAIVGFSRKRRTLNE